MVVQDIVYGERGILAYDAGQDRVQCHICGRWLRALGTHIRQAHRWSADDYREEFGLNRGQSLICQGTREILRELNKKQGNWKHLISQTASREELKEFLVSVNAHGMPLRTQACIGKRERLLKYNPMNEPEVVARRIVIEREVWYDTPRMRSLARSNIRKAMATVRARNLAGERYKCSCGAIFPIRNDLRDHKKVCSLGRIRPGPKPKLVER